MSVPVYLVDDDEAVRRALSLLLSTVDIQVTTFSDPTAFLAKAAQLTPGCLILDIRMPMISGLKLQEKLADSDIDWPTVVISGHGDIEACRRAFRNGAMDFLSKPVDEQDLIDAVQKGQVAQEQRSRDLAEREETSRIMSALSDREREVLSLVARGFATREIADALSLSPRTVESHRAAIASKLGTTSPAELALMWAQAQNSP